MKIDTFKQLATSYLNTDCEKSPSVLNEDSYKQIILDNIRCISSTNNRSIITKTFLDIGGDFYTVVDSALDRMQGQFDKKVFTQLIEQDIEKQMFAMLNELKSKAAAITPETSLQELNAIIDNLPALNLERLLNEAHRGSYEEHRNNIHNITMNETFRDFTVSTILQSVLMSEYSGINIRDFTDFNYAEIEMTISADSEVYLLRDKVVQHNEHEHTTEINPKNICIYGKTISTTFGFKENCIMNFYDEDFFGVKRMKDFDLEKALMTIEFDINAKTAALRSNLNDDTKREINELIQSFNPSSKNYNYRNWTNFSREVKAELANTLTNRTVELRGLFSEVDITSKEFLHGKEVIYEIDEKPTTRRKLKV